MTTHQVFNLILIQLALLLLPSFVLMQLFKKAGAPGWKAFVPFYNTWVIQDLEYYPKSTVNIFNRWGQKVFTSIGYPIPWDGTYQGKTLSSGTYYYIIDPKNGQAALAGWVAIIR